MARRRMIDPNIWASEDMAKLTLRQRLMVIGMFSNADDHGKGIAKPAYIRSTIFAYDDIPINEIIDDLETIRAIITIHFYEVEGNSYYRFVNWLKWQTVQKPQISLIPDSVENDSGISQESFSSKGKEEKGKEVGKEEKGTAPPVPTFDGGHKDIIREWLKKYNVECKGISQLEDISAYYGPFDIEVIEHCIKKAENQHVPYAISILERHKREKKTTKESILPKVGESNEKHEGELRHEQSTGEDKPITGGAVGWLPSAARNSANVIQLRDVSG